MTPVTVSGPLFFERPGDRRNLLIVLTSAVTTAFTRLTCPSWPWHLKERFDQGTAYQVIGVRLSRRAMWFLGYVSSPRCRRSLILQGSNDLIRLMWGEDFGRHVHPVYVRLRKESPARAARLA